jgi:hypothetical protein
MCAAISFESGRPYCFTSDPNGGDGVIYDPVDQRDWPTEHVYVRPAGASEARNIASLILDAVRAKEEKGGAAYAAGKTLIVFLDAGLGEWKPNAVARMLAPGNFKNVWLVGLQSADQGGRYTYAVVCLRTGLDRDQGAPSWLVRINETSEAWEVARLQ